MSSLELHESGVLFVAQSGIATWEDPEPITDWKWKTVSVVSRELSAVVALQWEIIANQPPGFRRVIRVYLASIPRSATESQKRRLVADLKTTPRGFSETTLDIAEDVVCAASELSDPPAVDPAFLTEYRHCALLGLDERTPLAVGFCKDVRETILDFGSSNIARLLAIKGSTAIFRTLDLGSHRVVQLIGPSEASDAAVRCLTERRIRQLHDVRALPQEIASLSK